MKVLETGGPHYLQALVATTECDFANDGGGVNRVGCWTAVDETTANIQQCDTAVQTPHIFVSEQTLTTCIYLALTS